MHTCIEHATVGSEEKEVEGRSNKWVLQVLVAVGSWVIAGKDIHSVAIYSVALVS